MPCHKQGSKPRPSTTPQWVGELETLWIDRSKHVLYLCHHNHNFQWHYDIIILIWSLSSCWIDYHHLSKSGPNFDLKGVTSLRLPPDDIDDTVNELDSVRVVTLRPVVPCATLSGTIQSSYRHGKTSQCSKRSKLKRCFLNFLLQVSIIWLPNCLICLMFRCEVWLKCKM